MNIRFKVLLVSGMAMTLVVVLGGVIYSGVSSSRAFRQRILASQSQLDSYTELYAEARRYLLALLNAKSRGGDTAALLEEMQHVIALREASLQETVRQELMEEGLAIRPSEWADTVHVIQALRRWSTEVEAAVRALPPDASLLSEEWRLFEEFERTVGQQLVEAREEEYEEKAQLTVISEEGLKARMKVAFLVPGACLVLLLLLTLFTIVPMNRAWGSLVAALRRMGEGDLGVLLPEDRRDELGVLAKAFNKMARELKLSLEEKERLVKAEAEASEREIRRYNQMLEETVRTRTSELEQANARLSESLRTLQTTQAQLIHSDRLAAMGRLAAGVGHEINNPLSYVISNLSYLHGELIRSRFAPSEEEREELMEVLSAAREGAERVRLIVKDLKTLARPEGEGYTRVELAEVVRGAAKLAAHELRYRARLVESCDSVPPVLGSSARLGQVFLNLIVNAAHAIPPGKSHENEVRVVAWQTPPDRVTVEVSDTGCGIPPENLQRIFEPFFTTKPVGVGMGLGLSVCHSIISAMGGEMEVRSEVGRGTTFRITLPVAEGATQAAVHPVADEPGDAPVPRSSGE